MCFAVLSMHLQHGFALNLDIEVFAIRVQSGFRLGSKRSCPTVEGLLCCVKRLAR